jgi:hypothetical protein
MSKVPLGRAWRFACRYGCFGLASSNQSTVEKLKEPEVRWGKAFAAKDSGTLDSILAADATEITSDGEFLRRDEILHKFDDSVISDEESDMSVRVYGNTAVMTGMSTVKRRKAEKAEIYRFTDTFVNVKGDWKWVATQESRVAGT